MLPKKLTSESKINLVHTSSPVSASDIKSLNKVVSFLKKDHPNVTVFDVERTNLDPRYLAASENERLKKFRQAIREVDWLAPVYALGQSLTEEAVFEQLRGFSRQSPHWIVGDPAPAYSKLVERLRQRGVAGPLWSYMAMLQRIMPPTPVSL